MEKNKRGIGTEHQVCVWGAVQRAEDGKPKRARAVVHLSKNLHFKQLYRLMEQNVDISKSKLITDGLLGYKGFKAARVMEHKFCQHNTGWYVNSDDWGVHTNNIESLWRCITSNINGCRHKFSKRHLQKYLDKAVYRHNYKEEGSRFAFDNVLKRAVA